jgi:hypothetical protein
VSHTAIEDLLNQKNRGTHGAAQPPFLSDRSVLGQQTNYASFGHVESTGQNLRGGFAYDAVIESLHSRCESVQRCGKLESFSNRETCIVTMDAYVGFSNAMLKVLVVQRLE